MGLGPELPCHIHRSRHVQRQVHLADAALALAQGGGNNGPHRIAGRAGRLHVPHQLLVVLVEDVEHRGLAVRHKSALARRHIVERAAPVKRPHPRKPAVGAHRESHQAVCREPVIERQHRFGLVGMAGRRRNLHYVSAQREAARRDGLQLRSRLHAVVVVVGHDDSAVVVQREGYQPVALVLRKIQVDVDVGRTSHHRSGQQPHRLVLLFLHQLLVGIIDEAVGRHRRQPRRLLEELLHLVGVELQQVEAQLHECLLLQEFPVGDTIREVYVRKTVTIEEHFCRGVTVLRWRMPACGDCRCRCAGSPPNRPSPELQNRRCRRRGAGPC